MSFVVQIKTFFDPQVKSDLLDLSESAYKIFSKQRGIVSVTMYLSHKEDHTMTILIWKEEDDHLACMRSPDFDDWNRIWEEMEKKGDIRWEMATYKSLMQ